MIRVHGGVKFYRGAAKAARAYVERDRSRADDYYLGEGTGVAEHLTATPEGVEHAGSMDGDTYEQWVAGIDIETGAKKGRLLKDEHASLCKAHSTVRMREAVGWAREVLGGNGILLEHHVGRFVADAEAIYSYEGTREINTLIVGRAITGESAFV